MSQFQPYEYVKLYQQPPDRRRPIVLIGPRNVGRYELRNRLTDEEPQRFCVPIAHTSRPINDAEVNGQDYYFVSKENFETLKKVSHFKLRQRISGLNRKYHFFRKKANNRWFRIKPNQIQNVKKNVLIFTRLRISEKNDLLGL